MTDHDESLEVGIAAGLDIPTAMVLSSQDESPTRNTGCALVFVLAILMSVTSLWHRSVIFNVLQHDTFCTSAADTLRAWMTR